MGMFLKGAIRLKKGPSRFSKSGSPWVFSNELVEIDTSLPPGSWVVLEGHDGQAVAYGHFNPHSLIAFRAFERTAFRGEEQTRAFFFKRLDSAWQTRVRAELGPCSFRLAFGESDGVPGLIIDLYNPKVAVIQCHSAGADNFVFWAQQWLEERMGVSCGVIRNDLDVRKKEHVELTVSDWGKIPADIHALEGDIRFFIDPHKGQKTGYFYDHRVNRQELAKRAGHVEGDILDCFTYVGSWGLQALKRNPKARLTAVDVSAVALTAFRRNAEENGFAGRYEAIEADFFKDKKLLAGRRFATVISDPPALTSSAKQADEGRRAHEACFYNAMGYLAPGGIAALASCSYHLGWDDFMDCVQRAGLSRNRQLRVSYVGSQSADHPMLSTMPETRYLKCVIVDELTG